MKTELSELSDANRESRCVRSPSALVSNVCSTLPGVKVTTKVSEQAISKQTISEETIGQFRASLVSMDRSIDNAARVDILRALEELKASCAGAQALLAADLDAFTRKDRGERGVPRSYQGRGINAQIASHGESRHGSELSISTWPAH